MSEGKTKECGFFDRVRRILYMIERELFRLLYIVIDAIVSYLRPYRRRRLGVTALGAHGSVAVRVRRQPGSRGGPSRVSLPRYP